MMRCASLSGHLRHDIGPELSQHLGVTVFGSLEKRNPLPCAGPVVAAMMLARPDEALALRPFAHRHGPLVPIADAASWSASRGPSGGRPWRDGGPIRGKAR